MTENTVKAVELFAYKYAALVPDKGAFLRDLQSLIVVAVKEATDHMLGPIVFADHGTLKK